MDRERSSDSLGEASGVSVAASTGLERISKEESPHAKRSGLSTRVEFEEVGESGMDTEDREVRSEGDGAAEGCVFDAGCGEDRESDGASGVGLAAGMEGVTEGLPCAASARTTAS